MQDDVVRKIAVIFVTDVVGFSKKSKEMKIKLLKVSNHVKIFSKLYLMNMGDGFLIRQVTLF